MKPLRWFRRRLQATPLAPVQIPSNVASCEVSESLMERLEEARRRLGDRQMKPLMRVRGDDP